MVYARQVAGQELTFGVSGKLIMNAVVMYDHQTETLWSQFLSLGVDGPLAGTRLELLPTLQTDWKTWLELHPDTLMLDAGRPPGRDSYAGYYRGGRAGILGEKNRDDRLAGKELVLALEVDGNVRAYAFSRRREQPVVNDMLSGRNVLVTFDAPSNTALTFDMEPGEDGGFTLRDRETGTQWAPLTGEALSGKLVGRRLRQLPANYTFWFAWTDFYPDTEL
jgi:hypothetical protein